MYSIYNKKKDGNHFNYSFSEEAHLFGCNEGWIPWLISKIIDKNQNEPFKWHLDFNKLLPENGYPNKAFIIDIKPKADDDVVMAELLNVRGYSSSGWSPFLLEMNILHFDGDDKKNFIHSGVSDIVYSFLYARGTVKDGQIIGTWNPASRSPTNAALLWPDAMKYFFSCISKKNPEMFEL